MYESELVDILVGISEGNYIVEQRQVQKGSKQAEEAKQVMAVLAYRGMKEGSAIYRKSWKKFYAITPWSWLSNDIRISKNFSSWRKSF